MGDVIEANIHYKSNFWLKKGECKVKLKETQQIIQHVVDHSITKENGEVEPVLTVYIFGNLARYYR